MKKLTQISLCLLFTFLIACSESVEPTPIEYYRVFTGTEQKTWVVSGIQWIDHEEGNTLDFGLRPCALDNEHTFYANADRRYEFAYRSRCESDGNVDGGTWSFVNATATLTFSLPILLDDPLPYIVRSVTDTDMELEIYIDQDNRYSYRIFMTAIDEE